MKTQAELIQEIEKLVDSSDLFNVTMALALMCTEKVEHIETNWQDKATAKPWRRSERILTTAARNIAVFGV